MIFKNKCTNHFIKEFLFPTNYRYPATTRYNRAAAKGDFGWIVDGYFLKHFCSALFVLGEEKEECAAS
jgi:hypothetical protein